MHFEVAQHKALLVHASPLLVVVVVIVVVVPRYKLLCVMIKSTELFTSRCCKYTSLG